MIKKILHFLSHFLFCAFFAFVSVLVLANRMEEPYNVVINGVLMTRGVASKIINSAKNTNVDVLDKNGNVIDKVAKGMVATIEDGRSMDIISQVYEDVDVETYEMDDYTKRELNGVVVIVSIKKKEKLVECYIIK